MTPTYMTTETHIADTSALLSLFDQQDANHPQALAASQELDRAGQLIIIPSDVLSETVNVIGRKLGHTLAVDTGKLLLSSGLFVIEPVSEQLQASALEKLERQPQSVSFTDCLVMASADAHHTHQIFGFDAAFATSGYQIPLEHSQAA
jgi:predicted nucleic acid-binding protein